MKKKVYGWYVVFINAFIGCVMSAGFPQASMTIAYISEKTGIGQSALLFGETIRTSGIIVAMIISGFVYKKIGARKLFILGMAMGIPAMIATPYSTSLIVFYILKFIQGMSSLVFPMFLVIIIGWIREKDHGLSTAVFNGIFYGGAGIGGTFSGFIINQFGWIESYWALALIQLALVIIWLFTVKENRTPAEAKETKGTVTFVQMLKMPVMWLLVLSFLSTTWSVQAISTDMPLFASYLGYGEIQTGKVLSAITIGILSACLVSGKVSDFFAARSKNRGAARTLVLMVGCLIVALSVLMLIVLDMSKFSLFYVVVLFFSFGASWGLGSFYSILPEIFDAEALPVATGFIGGCGDLGMTLAPVVVGIVFGLRGFWNVGWGICIVAALLSAVASLAIIRIIKK